MATLPPERNLYARARLDGATLVFGGQALDASYRGDLWLLAMMVAAQSARGRGRRPGTCAGAEIVTDPDAGRVLLFGGRDASGGLADLWVLTGVPADG